jgi:hypothetical protein
LAAGQFLRKLLAFAGLPIGRFGGGQQLGALGLARREALWAIKGLRDAPPPLFAAAARREAEPWSWRPPGGENYPDLLARTAPLVEQLRTHPAECLLVVSHGTLARPLLGRLLGLEPDTMLVVMVPNDLAYRVDLGAAQGPRASHVRAGVEQPGLLLRAS